MFNTASLVPISAGRWPEGWARILEDRRTIAENERAMDQALADSFPASDPPPWTLGVPHASSEAHALARLRLSSTDVVDDEGPQLRDAAKSTVIVSSGSRGQSTIIQWLTTLASAMGVAFLVPIAILIVGLPIVLIVRGVVEAVAWVRASVLN